MKVLSPIEFAEGSILVAEELSPAMLGEIATEHLSGIGVPSKAPEIRMRQF